MRDRRTNGKVHTAYQVASVKLRSRSSLQPASAPETCRPIQRTRHNMRFIEMRMEVNKLREYDACAAINIAHLGHAGRSYISIRRTTPDRIRD